MVQDLNKYVDINKEYYILVPHNAEADERMLNYEFRKDDKIADDFSYMVFHEDTFLYMEKRLFDFINVELDILINMYEEEYIENDKLEKVREIISTIVKNTDDQKLVEFANQFQGLIDIAIEKNTEIGLFF